MQYEEQFNVKDEIIGDIFGVNLAYDELQDFDTEDLSNEKIIFFNKLLKERNTPLFDGSSDSKLSMCVRFLVAKSNWNFPYQYFKFFVEMKLDVTHVKENMHISHYDTKMMVSKLGLEVQKIDCGIGGCILFYNN